MGNLQKKYPNISFEALTAKENPLEALASLNVNIDIFTGNANVAARFADMGYVMDMSQLIKTYNFDIGKVEPAAINIIRNASNGNLTALPIYINHHVLFYNRDIFEKFAEDYPRNHMTWDETYELARKMTRKDGDVQYLGFAHQFMNGTFALLNSYGQELIDPKTKEVTFENGVWAKMYQNFKRFFDIHGNEYLTGQPSVDAFAKDQRLAMLVSLSNRITGNPNLVPPNWDLVSLPEFSDARGTGSGIEPYYFYLSSTSKHSKEAFVAISHLLSEEVQKELALRGRHPIVLIPEIDQFILENMPSVQGRNVSGLFATQVAPALTLSEDTIAVRPPLNAAVDVIMKGEQDVNTALREAAEKARAIIKEREATK